ncbi:MAG: hypothetical protein WEB06_12770 [Actinomycetota bacterium]
MLGIRVRRLSRAEAYELLRGRSWPVLLVDIFHGALWIALPFTFR